MTFFQYYKHLQIVVLIFSGGGGASEREENKKENKEECFDFQFSKYATAITEFKDLTKHHNIFKPLLQSTAGVQRSSLGAISQLKNKAAFVCW